MLLRCCCWCWCCQFYCVLFASENKLPYATRKSKYINVNAKIGADSTWKATLIKCNQRPRDGWNMRNRCKLLWCIRISHQHQSINHAGSKRSTTLIFSMNVERNWQQNNVRAPPSHVWCVFFLSPRRIKVSLAFIEVVEEGIVWMERDSLGSKRSVNVDVV